jgi:type II secretory pathway component PulC
MLSIDAKYHDIKEKLNTPLIASVFMIVLALGILWKIGSTAQGIWSSNRAVQAQPFRAPIKINTNLLSSYHLFGAYASNLGNLPLASLGVTLIGIFADNNNKSTALITLSGGQSKFYHVGDKLAPNVVIDKILPYSVVVQHNGRLEKLAMPIQPLKFSNELPSSGLWR